MDLAPAGAQRDQRKKTGFGTKTQALDDMQRAQTQKADGTYVEPSRLTLAEFLSTWLAGGCGGVRPWTLKGYESIVRVHIVPRLGRMPIQQLTRQHVKALYEELRVEGRTPKLSPEHQRRLEDVARRYRTAAEAGSRSPVRALARELSRPEPTVRSWVRRCQDLGLLPGTQQAERKTRRKGLSSKSVWNVHICLRAALNDAIEDGLLKANPAKGAMKEPKGAKEMKTWTAEELRAFLAMVEGDRNFALYRVAAYSGMRRGELLGLRWQDLKLHLSCLSVQQQLGFVDDEEGEEIGADDAAPVFVPVKTEAGRRSIRLDLITLGVLKDHRARQESERRSQGAAYNDYDLVFCRQDGSPFDPDTVSGQFERLVRRSGLPRIRFHDYADLRFRPTSGLKAA